MVIRHKSLFQLLLYSLVIYLLAVPVFHTDAQLSGNNWTSPDGTLSIHLIYNEYGDASYSIVNNTTKHLGNAIPVDTRLLYIKWTNNPNFVIVVEHLAGGTIARVLAFTKGKWMVNDIYPPGPWPKFSVIGIDVHHNKAIFRYKVGDADRKYSGVCSFGYDLQSNDISEVSNIRISERKFSILKELGD